VSEGSIFFKRRVGKWFFARSPVSRHLFEHVRLELNAVRVRLLNAVLPARRRRFAATLQKKDLLVNIGCGPFGLPGWLNIDLFPLSGVTLNCDSRRRFPLAEGSAKGIHVEHFFEHLDPFDERPKFIAECIRCLEFGGVLRSVVPDAERFIQGYLSPGWDAMRKLAADGDDPQKHFDTKMEALNHIFLQGHEHFGGYDYETLFLVLRKGGFSDVSRCQWREGNFPGGCIDCDQHRRYSLYVEAVR
jgi:predicted SAM-dependent methyltransferase